MNVNELINKIGSFLSNLFFKKETKMKVTNLTISKELPTGGKDGDVWIMLIGGE